MHASSLENMQKCYETYVCGSYIKNRKQLVVLDIGGANINGSYADIAGICNLEGNVFGMMPHPERCLDRFEQGQWTRDKSNVNEHGDGYYLFQSACDFVRKNL